MTLPFLKSAPGETPVIVEGTIKADVARVYQAWTDPEDFKKWFGREPGQVQSAQLDARPDGLWEVNFFGGENGQMSLHGRYIEVAPGEKLVFSWQHRNVLPDGGVEESPESRVTIHFTMEKGGTALRLVHEAIQAQDARKGVGMGWNNSIKMLKGLVETVAA